MELVVSRAMELLQTMVDEGRSPKWMAGVTGYSYQQTWKYIQGDANPTTEFLNRLFVATKDPRLVDLITGGSGVMIQMIDTAASPVRSECLLSELIALRRHELKREEYILKILEDGKITEQDKPAVDNFLRESWSSIQHQFAMIESIRKQFDAATGKRA